MNLPPRQIAALVAAVAVAIVVGSAAPRAYTTYSRWASPTAVVYINPANRDGLSDDAVIAALQAAMDDWTTQGHSPFTFSYGGRVNDTAARFDNRNVVLFRNESNSGMIAGTYSWTDASNRLLDSDTIIYDAAGYTFYASDGSCNASLGNGVYLHDLTTHEFGHMLGLQHSSDPSATMASGYATCSTTQRTLESDDIAGIQSLYGTSSAPPPPPPTSTVSPDGTTVPTASQIVDTVGAVWTLGANGAILRNGVQAGGGWATKILWSSATIYAFGTDGNWWQWTGSSWINLGTKAPGQLTSPDGTMVPTALQIVDNVGAVWTIGLNSAILRNGVQAGGGWGTKILWKNATIYAFGSDSNWWQWTGSGWTNVGTTVPGGIGTSPDGTMVPSALQIVDNVGAVWTIGLTNVILRNGIQAGGGWGVKILWKNATIYVLGTDTNWWRWTGAVWTWYGPTQP